MQTKYIKKREQRHKRCIKIVCKRLMNTSKKFSQTIHVVHLIPKALRQKEYKHAFSHLKYLNYALILKSLE